ncbi:DUF417 family protein [Dyella sp. GSA-30]|uniref:YkgB family protein n=1 Tax=Dyella sp. GSA-30 TaxID=2994496 RepID=UPI0024915BBB|nr:DUF417 family protein [Dyella sp. GSA-30]BDU18845.1 hypothetical protein DYGSA30_03020 [Dyella sp. GSA-30]
MNTPLNTSASNLSYVTQGYSEPKKALVSLSGTFEMRLFSAVMVLIFFMFGYTKWFDYEAQGLVPLIGNSPILGWMHTAFGVHGASYALGVAEWSIGLLLLAGLRWAPAAFLGALGSIVTFAITPTMIFSTPGAWQASAGGFPAMGGATSFLIKDLVLLAVSIAMLRHTVRAWLAKK